MSKSLVLIADDNAVDRQILTAIVEQAGHPVAQACNGKEALRIYRELRPTIILLDALMPELDGFEVAKAIKAEPEGAFASVVFLTSLKAADELANCVNSGGDDFLSKPYNVVILHAKLRALSRIQELHQRLHRQSEELRGHNSHLLHEQEAAKGMFDSVALRGYLDVPYIDYLISPLAVFNGDVLLAAPTPRGTLHLLLGDFTGHGLTASIGALPLSEIFYGMTQKGFTLSDIVAEGNRKLHNILPVGYFCCALIAELNFAKHTIEFWNGGLPPGCLVRSSDQSIGYLHSKHLPLGVLPTSKIKRDTEVLETQVGDRLVLCTDGIIEAQNTLDEQFGSDRFEKAISQQQPNCIENLQAEVVEHMGEQARIDDFTVVDVRLLAAEEIALQWLDDGGEPESGAEDWQLTYELRDSSLRQFNPLPLLVQLLMHCPPLRARSADLHLVLAELYSNALEHGVLRLDSRLKRSSAGFQEYYLQRAKALEAISGRVCFEFDCRREGDRGTLIVRVADSGPGFDYAKNAPDNGPVQDQRPEYFGRGMALISDLCDSVQHAGNGNITEARLSWVP